MTEIVVRIKRGSVREDPRQCLACCKHRRMHAVILGICSLWLKRVQFLRNLCSFTGTSWTLSPGSALGPPPGKNFCSPGQWPATLTSLMTASHAPEAHLLEATCRLLGSVTLLLNVHYSIWVNIYLFGSLFTQCALTEGWAWAEVRGTQVW